MSLRARLVAVIMLALLISFVAGAGLAAWWAVRAVGTELASALAVGRASAEGAMAAASADGFLDAAEMRRIVAAYDGDRHVRAELRDRVGRVLAASRTASAGMPPQWFLDKVSPTLSPAILAAGDDMIVLEADATNEGLERWNEMRREVGLLALFCVVAATLCSVTAARSLRPLIGLSTGLARLGDRDRNVCVPVAGPPEIAALARSFNALSAALQAALDLNMKLQMQAELLADEERAEIARDLHDEVGPLLFAITTFTATIGRLASDGDVSAIPPQLCSIQEATSGMQSLVHDMLGRLNDVTPQSAPLAERLEDLVAFWRTVQPTMIFTVSIDREVAALTGRTGEAMFRVAQESVSNAVRHGRPRLVTVSVQATADGASLRVADDGQGGPEAFGYGLAGMRARVAAIGGRLDVTPGQGWTITAIVPLQPCPLPSPLKAASTHHPAEAA